MQKNWNETQLDYFKLCKLLKNAGYKEGSNKFFIEYREDYVYDEDPNHPESHKKGEIRVYNTYFRNCKEGSSIYELPRLEDINDWLLNERDYYVCIGISDSTYFDAIIYKKEKHLLENNDILNTYTLIERILGHIKSPDEAYINAFIRILEHYLK